MVTKRRRAATRKPLATDEVFASPKVVEAQKIETTPQACYPPHLGARKAWGTRENKSCGKYPSKSWTSLHLKFRGKYLEVFINRPSEYCPGLDDHILGGAASETLTSQSLNGKEKALKALTLLFNLHDHKEGDVRNPYWTAWSNKFVCYHYLARSWATPTYARTGPITTNHGGFFTRSMIRHTTGDPNYHREQAGEVSEIYRGAPPNNLDFPVL